MAGVMGWGADAPPPGCTWSEVDAEGSQFLIHGKKHIAFATFNKAADAPGGCGWHVFAHRADCKLRLLDFAGALEDASRAVDMYSQEQREKQQSPLPVPAAPIMTAADALWREAELEDALVLASRLRARRQYVEGGFLIGDEQGQRVEGLKADIRHALDRRVARVLRRKLVRAMLRHKGINPRRLTAGRRLSWVTISSIQSDAPAEAAAAGSQGGTPLPLPIVWGASPLLGQASDDEDSDEAEGESEMGESEMGEPVAADEQEEAADEQEGDEEAEGAQDGQGGQQGDDGQGDEAAEAAAAEDDAQGEPAAEAEPPAKKCVRLAAAGDAPGPPDGPRWGWLRQVPGHEHICADPLVKEQADRIAELRTLGRLEQDRGYLRRLLGLLQSVQARPGEQRSESGCSPCPGPNLSKWRDEVLRADRMDEKQDPLAASKWAAQDLARKTLADINHMVQTELMCKPRYLHPGAARGPSPQMRAARTAGRRDRAISTVHFMLRRLHDSLVHNLNRDVELVGERLTTFLERLPCRVFEDRLLALARTLDCRAVAARRRNSNKLAVEMQKRRCTLAADHGMSALYNRAMDEMGLLMFSVADYPLAESSWNERLARLNQRYRALRAEQAGDEELRPVREQRAQVVFQLARCCFVQGFLRMAGVKADKQAAKKDHRTDLSEFSLGLAHTSSDLFKQQQQQQQLQHAARRSSAAESSADEAEAEEADAADDDKLYPFDWAGDCRWSPRLLGYDLGGDDVIDYCPVELKPASVEACLKIIMDILGTEDPLNQYGHLLVMERYPDPEDGPRPYPLMPPDFHPDNNIMDKQYEVFERRFVDACHYFVRDITGLGSEPEAPAAPPANPASSTEPEVAASPEPERLPSVTEEPEAHDEDHTPGAA